MGLNARHILHVKAACAEEQAYFQCLTTTFNISDPKIVTDVPTSIKTLIALVEAFVAVSLAAARRFTILGEPQDCGGSQDSP